MKIEPVDIEQRDKLYRLDTVSLPWRITEYQVLRTMPKYLDIESISTKKRLKKRIRRDLQVAVGMRYLQEYFLSVKDLLVEHRRRTVWQIGYSKRKIESSEESLQILDGLEVSNGA